MGRAVTYWFEPSLMSMETEIGFGLVGSLCALCGRRIRNTGREINNACARGRDCEEREVPSTIHAHLLLPRGLFL